MGLKKGMKGLTTGLKKFLMALKNCPSAGGGQQQPTSSNRHNAEEKEEEEEERVNRILEPSFASHALYM